MARPKKATVDYFPHMATHSKTLFLLESKWGNDGYAVWFKLLEKLASTDGHFIDCREETSLIFLAALTRISEENLTSIIDMLAYLKAIDRGLWQHKVIFCQHFVDNIADLYQRRKIDIPTREGVIANTKIVIADINPENEHGNPQSKVNESKVYKTITTAAGTKAELALSEAFEEREDVLRKTFPQHDFEVVKQGCLAYYRNKPPPMDPYHVAYQWFQRQQTAQPTVTRQKGLSDDFEKTFCGTD